MILQLSGIGKRFSDMVVIPDLALSVEEGEFVGVIGPNRAGKTTLSPDCGIAAMRPRRRTPRRAIDHATERQRPVPGRHWPNVPDSAAVETMTVYKTPSWPRLSAPGFTVSRPGWQRAMRWSVAASCASVTRRGPPDVAAA